MSKAEYIAKVGAIKEAIRKGDLYQANLTRKFICRLKNDIYPYEIFKKLVMVSPSPYSAFIRHGDLYILSSSPERFVTVTYDGRVESRPIKGSAARSEDKQEDFEIAQALAASTKDQAENLMIVDLMRHDLSKTCLPGSIEVSDLFAITTYATVHHMSSTIRGTRAPDKTALDVVKACFPPGSMTGAPKIKAMQRCSQLEKVERGIYSGAIGWFGGDGSADFSVVIRTIVMQGNVLEFQVGGAIVDDSDPEKEWQETLLKAKAIASVLGITTETLQNL